MAYFTIGDPPSEGGGSNPMVIDPKLAVTKRGCNGAEGGAAARNVKMLVRVPSPTLLTELTLGYIGEKLGGEESQGLMFKWIKAIEKK